MRMTPDLLVTKLKHITDWNLRMSKLRMKISMSLDGFVAGPNQSVKDPLGVGGMRLHEWAFPLAAFRSMHGEAGGEVNESSKVVEESIANIGATIMGRNMFGGHTSSPNPLSINGEGGPNIDWKGWWGNNPPFHHPVFVLTHYPREPLKLEGGNIFTFITEGIEAALDQARMAAGGSKDISLAGGAKACQQYLIAGLVDEMEISLVPTLLGSGERLFDGVGDSLHGLELVRTVAAPKVTHLKFVRP
jgi:dihydrofolate reductase